MSWNIDRDNCTGCGICVDTCSQEAITIQDGLATISENLCVDCGSCAQDCPVGAISESG